MSVVQKLGMGSVWARLKPLSIEYRNTYINNANQLTYTFTNCDFGEEAEDRVIIVAVHVTDGAASLIPATNHTIGGVAATRRTNSLSFNTQTAIIDALVPTGTTGTIFISLINGGTREGCWISVYRMTGYASREPVAALSGTSAVGDITLAPTVQKGDQGVYCYEFRDAGAPTLTADDITTVHYSGNPEAGTRAVDAHVYAQADGAFSVAADAPTSDVAAASMVFWQSQRPYIASLIPPVNAELPTISGSAVQGNELTCDPGLWAGSPAPTFTYQWKRNGGVLGGETNSTYTTVLADVGTQITCEVTATNSEGVSSQSTDGLLILSAGDGPVNTVAPAITGNPLVGVTLSCSTGTWTGTPTPTYAYQWRRDGSPITDETASTYLVVAGDLTHDIDCVVTATNASGPVDQASNTVTIGEVPANTALPAISGTLVPGSVLSVTTGSWSGFPTPAISYQWTRNGGDIGGEVGNSYTILESDYDTTIDCDVTGTNAHGAVEVSATGGGTVIYPPVNSAVPRISGVALIGETLTCAPGVWLGNPTPTITYQWKRNGVDIPVATASTYATVTADLEQDITCTVTATNTHGAASLPSNIIHIQSAGDLQPTFKSGAVANTGVVAANSININIPGDAVAGDCILLLASKAVDGSGLAFDTPPGFSLVQTNVATPLVSAQYSLFRRIASSGDAGALVTIQTEAGANAHLNAIVSLWTNVNPNGVINIVDLADWSDALGTSHTIAGVTTTLDKTVAVAVCAYSRGNGFPFASVEAGWEFPAALQVTNDVTSANYCSSFMAYKEMPTQGAVGNMTFTAANADRGAFVMLALSPKPGTGGSPPPGLPPQVGTFTVGQFVDVDGSQNGYKTSGPVFGSVSGFSPEFQDLWVWADHSTLTDRLLCWNDDAQFNNSPELVVAWKDTVTEEFFGPASVPWVPALNAYSVTLAGLGAWMDARSGGSPVEGSTPAIDWAGATVYNANSGVTSFAINKPTVATGEILILIALTVGNNPAAGWENIAGWTRHVNHFSSTSDLRLAVYHRVVDGTEGASFTVVQSATTEAQRAIGLCARVQGADTTTPFDVIDTVKAFAATSSHTVDEITTLGVNRRVVSIFGFFGTDGAGVSTSGTGWTEQKEILGGNTSGNGGYPLLVVSDKNQATADLTGDVTHGTAVADRGASFQLALKPAATTGGETLEFYYDKLPELVGTFTPQTDGTTEFISGYRDNGSDPDLGSVTGGPYNFAELWVRITGTSLAVDDVRIGSPLPLAKINNVTSIIVALRNPITNATFGPITVPWVPAFNRYGGNFPGAAAFMTAQAGVALNFYYEEVQPEVAAVPYIGFGAATTGGEGGTVIYVTSGANSGAGTLREALQQTFPRIILFKVPVVTVTSQIQLGSSNANFSMYGQSAGGVIVRGAAGTWVEGQALIKPRVGDYIMQGMMFLVGSTVNEQLDCFSFGGGSGNIVSNVIADHNTFMWGIDECTECVGGFENFTFSHNIVAQGLQNSVHAEGEHSMGSLFEWSGGVMLKDATFFGNLYAYNRDRNPWIKKGQRYEWLCNQGYGMGCDNSRMGQFGANVSDTGDAPASGIIRNNHYQKSSESQSTTNAFTLDNQGQPSDWYVDGNVALLANGDPQSPLLLTDGGSNVSTTTAPFTTSGAENFLMNAVDVPAYIQANAGCFPPNRIPLEATLLSMVASKQPGIIDNQSEMGGYPTRSFTPRTDTDGDGIPDVYEGVYSTVQEYMAALLTGEATPEA